MENWINTSEEWERRAKDTRTNVFKDDKGGKAPKIEFEEMPARRDVAVEKPNLIADIKRMRTAMTIGLLHSGCLRLSERLLNLSGNSLKSGVNLTNRKEATAQSRRRKIRSSRRKI